MSTLDSLSGRALDIAQSIGDNLKQLTPRATTLLDAGAKLGALRAGTKVAGIFLRRNPAVVAATVVAGGLVWYAAHRKKQRDQANGHGDSVEGSARRVDARRGNASQTRRRTGTSRTRKATASE